MSTISEKLDKIDSTKVELKQFVSNFTGYDKIDFEDYGLLLNAINFKNTHVTDNTWSVLLVDVKASEDEKLNLNFGFAYLQGSGTIDWGDGNTSTGVNYAILNDSDKNYYRHQYSQAGQYVIKMKTFNRIAVGNGGYNLFNNSVIYAFLTHDKLQQASTSGIQTGKLLKYVELNATDHTGASSFMSTSALKIAKLHYVKNIGINTFTNSALKYVSIYDTESIQQTAFYNCKYLKYVDFSEFNPDRGIPNVAADSFDTRYGTKIIVPTNRYDEWKNSKLWEPYKDMIISK